MLCCYIRVSFVALGVDAIISWVKCWKWLSSAIVKVTKCKINDKERQSVVCFRIYFLVDEVQSNTKDNSHTSREETYDILLEKCAESLSTLVLA